MLCERAGEWRGEARERERAGRGGSLTSSAVLLLPLGGGLRPRAARRGEEREGLDVNDLRPRLGGRAIQRHRGGGARGWVGAAEPCLLVFPRRARSRAGKVGEEFSFSRSLRLMCGFLLESRNRECNALGLGNLGNDRPFPRRGRSRERMIELVALSFRELRRRPPPQQQHEKQLKKRERLNTE